MQMIKRFVLTLITAFISFNAQALATEAMQTEPIGVWELLKVSAGLLVVVAAIVATAAVLRRLKSMHAANGKHMKIIDGMSVSARERVVLLEVDQQRVLLGVSPGRISTLHVFAADAQPPFVEMVERAAPPQREAKSL